MKTNSHLYKPGEVLSLTIDRIFDGKHTEGTHATILSDISQRRRDFPFRADVVGKTIYNTTDESSGIITAYTIMTVTATLTGGSDNQWEKYDDYVIGTNVLVIQEQTQFRQIAYEQVTVATVGTAINPTANVGAKAVRVLNNNKDGRVAYVGVIAAGVDASVTPEKGTPLYEGDSEIFWVDNANEVYIDANQAASKFDVVGIGI